MLNNHVRLTTRVYGNETTTEEMEESLFADLILPLIVWTGMGIGEVIFATLVLVAIIMNKRVKRHCKLDGL